MASPRTAIQRFDYSLSFSEFSAYLNRQKFVGHLVFPPIYVDYQAASFRVMPPEALITPIEDTVRAPKAGYKRDDYEWTTASYITEENGVEEATDDRQLKMYGTELRAEMINRDRAINRVAQAYEAKCATAAYAGTKTDVVTNSGGGYGGYAWTNKANADPIKDIDKARNVFIANCGMAPNVLQIEQTALLAMMRTDRVEGIIKFTGEISALTMRNLVPQLQDALRIDKIIVADAPVKNTAGKNQTPTFARLWPTDKCLLTRVYDGPDMEQPEPFYGRTIMWSEEAGPLPGADGEAMGVLVEEYREENRRGGVIRARTDYQVKTIYDLAAFTLTGLT